MYEEVTTYDEARAKGLAARKAARGLAVASSKVKDAALHAMAEALLAQQEQIITANRVDLDKAKADGVTSAFIDRLTLNAERIAGMAEGLREVAALPDPVGEVQRMWSRPNGLEVGRVLVPPGVIGTFTEGT